MIAVRDHLDRLGDLQPVVVSFTDDPDRLAAYRRHLGIEFPTIADPDRRLYRALGAGRGRIRDIWSFGMLRLYARLVRRGRRLRLPREDTRQLGADAVIDADGRLVHVWLPRSPDQRPTVAEIAAVAADARRG